ncbi:heterokaryon incompatibility, partial [Macroventuria anomochaeta]
WATLNHCWGPNPTFVRLTESNVNAFRANLSLDILPPTCRDAVTFCQSLGLEFLWIDSLCILQEGYSSNDDWLLHSKAMCRIYSITLVKIA